MGAPSVFADAGVLCFEEGALVEGLEILSLRLEIAGAGSLLDVLMATCWGTDRDDCPHCRIPVRYHRDTKGTPDPHPKPPPPPPPPPPPQPGSTVAAGSDSARSHARCPGVESDPTGTAEPSEAADPRCGWG